MSKKVIFICLIIVLIIAFNSCEKRSRANAQDCSGCPSNSVDTETQTPEETCATERELLNSEIQKITFLELGSKTCIPCKKMEPVLASIEKRYGEQIEVIFHDIKQDKTVAKKYKIRLIPTQIFLDENGNELLRHEGFFPEKGIDEFLQSKGLEPEK